MANELNLKGLKVEESTTSGSFIKTGGTPSQFLKADGSVDNNSYNKGKIYTNVTDFGAVGSGVANDTVAIQTAIATGSNLFFPEGSYLINKNTLALQDGQFVLANGAELVCEEANDLAAGKISYFLKVLRNNKIEGLRFSGQGNQLYGLAGFSSGAVGKCENIEVIDCEASECGLIITQPEEGFTYNRVTEGVNDWFNFGEVQEQHISQNILVSRCRCYGDTIFTAADNLYGTEPSAFAFLFSRNVTVSDCFASHYRFGVWAYGGSNNNSANTGVNVAPLWCENITAKGNVVEETFSGLFFSKTKNSVVSGNTFNEWVDTTVDFEACTGCQANNNILINTIGGVALTALSDCHNIDFNGNFVKIVSDITGARIQVRDTCSNISYRGNRFVSEGVTGFTVARLKVSGERFGFCDGVTIQGNDFINFDVRCQDKTDRIAILDNNFFVEDESIYKNLIFCVDNNKRIIKGNIFDSANKSTNISAASGQISVVEGGSSTANKTTIIENNVIRNSNDILGIYTFVSLASNPEASIIIRNNVSNVIYANDSMIHAGADGIYTNIVLEGNRHEDASGNRLKGSLLKRINGTEKNLPIELKGAYNKNNLGVDWKEGDKVFRTNVVAGQELGWIFSGGAWLSLPKVAAIDEADVKGTVRTFTAKQNFNAGASVSTPSVNTDVVNKLYVDGKLSSGATGSFTTADGKTVTVTSGLITQIV